MQHMSLEWVHIQAQQTFQCIVTINIIIIVLGTYGYIEERIGNNIAMRSCLYEEEESCVCGRTIHISLRN